jgi:hypothetical protein
MKKRFLLGMLLFAAAVLVASPCGNPLFAVAGCCKQRTSYTGNWLKLDVTFQRCEQLNAQKDGDNVFDQQGLVWWDVRCR